MTCKDQQERSRPSTGATNVMLTKDAFKANLPKWWFCMFLVVELSARAFSSAGNGPSNLLPNRSSGETSKAMKQHEEEGQFELPMTSQKQQPTGEPFLLSKKRNQRIEYLQGIENDHNRQLQDDSSNFRYFGLYQVTLILNKAAGCYNFESEIRIACTGGGAHIQSLGLEGHTDDTGRAGGDNIQVYCTNEDASKGRMACSIAEFPTSAESATSVVHYACHNDDTQRLGTRVDIASSASTCPPPATPTDHTVVSHNVTLWNYCGVSRTQNFQCEHGSKQHDGIQSSASCMDVNEDNCQTNDEDSCDSLSLQNLLAYQQDVSPSCVYEASSSTPSPSRPPSTSLSQKSVLSSRASPASPPSSFSAASFPSYSGIQPGEGTNAFQFFPSFPASANEESSVSSLRPSSIRPTSSPRLSSLSSSPFVLAPRSAPSSPSFPSPHWPSPNWPSHFEQRSTPTPRPTPVSKAATPSLSFSNSFRERPIPQADAASTSPSPWSTKTLSSHAPFQVRSTEREKPTPLDPSPPTSSSSPLPKVSPIVMSSSMFLGLQLLLW